jgi:hypothetical protein
MYQWRLAVAFRIIGNVRHNPQTDTSKKGGI